jgi:hypothetical protein
VKRLALLVFILTLAYSLSACAPAEALAENNTDPVEDQASFLAALQRAGASAEVADPIEQIFFSTPGSIIKVNGMDVQVFEYESEQAMEAEVSQVAPDGGSIGTSMVSWIDRPHFYKAGRIIVLYVGSDTTILNLLNNILGPQFAGR